MVRLTVVLKQHGSTVADNESIRIFAQCQDVRFLYLPFFSQSLWHQFVSLLFPQLGKMS